MDTENVVDETSNESPAHLLFINGENADTCTKIIAKGKAEILSEHPWEIINYGSFEGHERRTVPEFMVQLLRHHSLHKNERQTVLSTEDQLVTVQLCLAAENKETIGDFDVESSKVIEFSNRLLDDKLSHADVSLLPPSQCEQYAHLKTRYDNQLANSNVMDQPDVLRVLKEEMKSNKAIQAKFNKTNFIVANFPDQRMDKEFIELLAQDKLVTIGKLAMSLDSTISDVGHIESAEVLLEQGSLEEAMADAISPRSNKSVTEQYVEKVILSYVQLLVNSRNELALAHALNVPDRGLDHKAFTDLKHAASEAKNMSLFQMATSFIMRIRLGGKSYAPDMSSPLAMHVKGLSEFTDITQKLQTVVEEDFNTESALRRVLTIIKNTILKAKDNNIRRATVETVTEILKNQAAIILQAFEKETSQSPSRSPGSGGSTLGKKTSKVLRTLVDHYSCLPMTCHSVGVLDDVVSSQRTPLRFPSVMSKFKSPVESSPDAEESKSLAMRIKEKQGSVKSDARFPRFQASINWVDPNINTLSGDIGITLEDYIPSKTIVHPGCAGREKGIVRKVLESICDQENVDSSMHSSNSVSCQPTYAKRPAAANLDTASRPTKRAKKSEPVKPKAKVSKKKVPTLQKGQKQLTSFFRV